MYHLTLIRFSLDNRVLENTEVHNTMSEEELLKRFDKEDRHVITNEDRDEVLNLRAGSRHDNHTTLQINNEEENKMWLYYIHKS